MPLHGGSYYMLTQCTAAKKPEALQESQKRAVAKYADTRDLEGGFTGETVMSR